MADDNDDAPAVELGTGDPIAGVPVQQVASRLQWPLTADGIRTREGNTEIRTSDGPRTVGSVLDDLDTDYFARRQEFVDLVRGVIGTGPVLTE